MNGQSKLRTKRSDLSDRFGLLLLVFLVGCGGAVPRPSNYSDDPKSLLDAIKVRAAAIRAMSCEVKMDVWHNDQRVKVTQLIATDDQGRLRLETISPFGQPIKTLVSDGARLMIYAADEKRFFLGSATPQNLARLLPVNLGPDELSALLRGSIPLIGFTSARVSWNDKNGRYRLQLESKTQRQLIEFEPAHLRATHLKTWTDGVLAYDATFGQYSGTGNEAIPKRILFQVAAENLKADMTVVHLTVNPTLPDAAFNLVPPRGITVEPI
ncbi:MAG: DUF4292 domain-containing protein [Myxococcota bacterium]|nr:DUF4292 domain-containing protein [Myxococcota bacterium]